MAGGARAAGGGTRAGHGRAGDDRRARRPVAPLTRELRAYARRQPGCRALMKPLRRRRADRGHDPRRARRRAPLLLLAPGGPLRRPGHHRPPVRSAPLARAPLPPRPAGVALGAVRGRPGRRRPGSPDRAYYEQAARAARRQPRLPRRSPASCSSAATTRCASSATRRCNPPEPARCAPSPPSHRCAAAGSPHAPAATTARGRP